MKDMKPIYMVLATMAAIALIVALVGWSVGRTDRAGSAVHGLQEVETELEASMDVEPHYMRLRAVAPVSLVGTSAVRSEAPS